MPRKKDTNNNFDSEGAYTLIIIGEAEAAFRGGTPADMKKLLIKTPKSIEEMYLKVANAAVDAAIQAGEIEKAAELVKKHERKIAEQVGKYGCPLNVFKEDRQAGGTPYIGAHAAFGAFRDSSAFVHIEEKYFYQKGRVGWTKLRSPKHLRKFVTVRPSHIFFHRPSMNGTKNVIRKPDGIEGQQPIAPVGGFAEYEYVDPPFQFQFRICVSPKGLFNMYLGKKDKVLEAINQMPNHGFGAGRSAGYGTWKIIDIEERSGILHDGQDT
jgi:hypothetical protein